MCAGARVLCARRIPVAVLPGLLRAQCHVLPGAVAVPYVRGCLPVMCALDVLRFFQFCNALGAFLRAKMLANAFLALMAEKPLLGRPGAREAGVFASGLVQSSCPVVPAQNSSSNRWVQAVYEPPPADDAPGR